MGCFIIFLKHFKFCLQFQRPINLVEEDEKAELTESEYGGDINEMELEMKEEIDDEEEGKDWTGEKAILQSILAKRRKIDDGEEDKMKEEDGIEEKATADDNDDGESSVVTDFEFQVKIGAKNQNTIINSY